MRPRAELDFIRDRVLAEIRANPATEPLLTDTAPQPRSRRGCQEHDAMVMRASGKRRCVECDRLRRLAKRDGG